MRAMAARRRFIPAHYMDALKNEDGEWTNLALMLSDQCPWRTEIRCGGEMRETIAGPVLAQSDGIQHAVTDIRRTEYGSKGFPTIEFSEVLLNAAAHRSYCDPSPVIVDVLPHMTVVTSPGGRVRVDHGYDGRTRNPRLASLATSMGLKNPKVSGVNGIIGAYRSC